jgi:hypothetical protein
MSFTGRGGAGDGGGDADAATLARATPGAGGPPG